MSLKDKLKKEIASSDNSKVDWEKRKAEWIDSVTELDNLIVDWFSDYKAEGLLDFRFSEKENSEEYIGTYNVNILHLCFSTGREIVIEPIGTLIIGAWARFDVYARGYNSAKYFILRYKSDSGEFSWHVSNPQNRGDVQPLSKEILESIFERWLLIKEYA